MNTESERQGLNPASLGAPALSVVVAANRAWPAIRVCLDRLCAQSSEEITEIVLADSSDQGLPTDFQRNYSRVRWLKFAGSSVFALRALGVSVARGKIIAVTEDHCIVGPEWCKQVIDSHNKNPEKVLISGPVVNGSTINRIEWANFLLTLGPFLPPVTEAAVNHRAPPISNMSFKREVFRDQSPLPGWLEFELVPRLMIEGKVTYDENVVVTHVQSHGLWETCRLHFHNGRSTMGLNREKGIVRQFKRIQSPRAMRAVSLEAVQSKREIGKIVRGSRNLMLLLACFHSLGELSAIVLRGAGRSPELLE